MKVLRIAAEPAADPQDRVPNTTARVLSRSANERRVRSSTTMTDDLTIDQALEKIIALSARINALEPDNPKRASLGRQRDELREDIQAATDASRSVPGLLNELGALQQRLTQIDDRPINEGWAEKARNRWVRWVNDPGAYSNRINEMLDAKDADEREAIVARIAEIEEVLDGSGAVDQ